MSIELNKEYVADFPIKSYHTLLHDMNKKDMTLFHEKLLACFEKEWFEKKDTDKIAEVFKRILQNNEMRYCVLIGLNPAYVIQSRKQTVWAVKIEDISIFIFKPKQIDIPILKKINFYNTEPEVVQKSKQYVDCFPIRNGRNIEGKEDRLARQQEWLALFVTKHETELNQLTAIEGNLSKEEKRKQEKRLELDLIQRFKMILMTTMDSVYWHIFYSPIQSNALVDGLTEEGKVDNCSFEIELKIPQFSKYEVTRKILQFQRKGHDDPFWTMLPSAWKEVFVFIAMFVMFLTFMSCPNNPERLIEGDFLHELICKDKSTITGYMAMCIIALGVYTMMKKKRDRAKQNLKNKQK